MITKHIVVSSIHFNYSFLYDDNKKSLKSINLIIEYKGTSRDLYFLLMLHNLKIILNYQQKMIKPEVDIWLCKNSIKLKKKILSHMEKLAGLKHSKHPSHLHRVNIGLSAFLQSPIDFLECFDTFHVWESLFNLETYIYYIIIIGISLKIETETFLLDYSPTLNLLSTFE